MKTSSYIIILVVKFVFLIFGSLILFGSILLIIKGNKTRNWKKTDGFIVSSTLSESSDSVGNISFSPNVSYSYKINDDYYNSTKVSVDGDDNESYHTALETVKKYSKGDHITVYYNPTKPDESVLERGTNLFKTSFNLLIGVICFIIGVLLFLKFLSLQLMKINKKSPKNRSC